MAFKRFAVIIYSVEGTNFDEDDSFDSFEEAMQFVDKPWADYEEPVILDFDKKEIVWRLLDKRIAEYNKLYEAS